MTAIMSPSMPLNALLAEAHLQEDLLDFIKRSISKYGVLLTHNPSGWDGATCMKGSFHDPAFFNSCQDFEAEADRCARSLVHESNPFQKDSIVQATMVEGFGLGLGFARDETCGCLA